MIVRQKIIEQLQGKWARFVDFNKSLSAEVKDYRGALKKLSQMSAADLESRLHGIDNPGAVPTVEFNLAPDLNLDFPHIFTNHQHAREWASEVLLDRTTVAVDGSQIRHDPDFSLPVAAVQVAWFENHHSRDGRYTKDTIFEILDPDELLVEVDGESIYSEQKVNLRRFEMEAARLCSLIEKTASGLTPSARLPVAFFDSSLVISFADRLSEELQQRHIDAVLKLLRCSRDAGIPLIGYVDSSRAHDLTRMLSHVFNLDNAEKLHDTRLISPLLAWGARTPMFTCARGSADLKKKGVLDHFDEFRREIGFVYLKAGGSSAPARLEIPKWIYDKGLLDEVLDAVRAEIIVGNGYPYVISAADAAAVINGADREAFYAIFQRFAEEQGIDTGISRKAASKARRR
jgi:hypothetical protein